MNHLAHEPSPYLRQHANNPVEWYPWGPAALERARKEDRPILLVLNTNITAGTNFFSGHT